ncbi:MAG TPA: hypothetical protein VFQ85_16740, partial [Mycobacteriales bacterium]|nr:hypothetical protein [Mycobacteriales bacterium]
MRPVLKPALRRLWRADDAIQLGADPGNGVVLDGLDPAAHGVLELLDGVRELDDVVTAAAEHGMPEPEVRGLLALLGDLHALDDAAAAPRGLARTERARLAPDLATLTLLTTQPGDAARTLD